MAESGGGRERREEEEDDVVCLDPSFFVDRSYEMTTFTFGSQVLRLLCLRAASTDYDLTGQLVWPGAVLMNTYLSEHPETVNDHSIIELGSGVVLTAEKLEWGNYAHISNIIEKHPESFQQSSISCLFDTVERLLHIQAVLKEAEKHGMHVKEVNGTRTTISNLEGVIYDITLK
uniref:Uncharacterized protein n=1 Tax=Leersia perrieri TaxID=77586 RepID=A0A0D9X231_9ORYZ